MGSFYVSDEYTEIGYDVIGSHKDLAWIADADLRICFMGTNEKKKSKGRDVLGECILVKDMYKAFCPYDFLIVIYDQAAARLNKEQMKVLFYHELLHVGMTEDKNGVPKYRVTPHDVEDFKVILDRYGVNWAGW